MLPSAIARSHLTRLVLIALELQHQGAEVAFAFPENNQILQHYNFQFFPVADAVVTDFSSNVFDAYTPSLIEQCVNDELKAIEAFKPDAIIGDFRLTAAISSKIAKITYISVVNGYMTDYFDPVEAMIPQVRQDLWNTKLHLSAAKSDSTKSEKNAGDSLSRELPRNIGPKKLVSLYDFLTGDLTLIADLPEYLPSRKSPSKLPLYWSADLAGVERYSSRLPKRHQYRSKQLIYATTGNTGKETFIQLVIDAFKNDTSYEVVLTTGAFIHPDAVPNISNIHVARFIPGSEILKQSQAVIHCGGNGTTYQAMAQGVPAVVIPFNNDQTINAWLIKRNKVGIPLSTSELTGEQVKLAVKKAIADIDMQKNLQHFKEILTKTNGPKYAADEISIAFLSNMRYPTVHRA
jgi:UDP:flavonoid glycosyltransferase YjiC (YdhE family)